MDVVENANTTTENDLISVRANVELSYDENLAKQTSQLSDSEAHVWAEKITEQIQHCIVDTQDTYKAFETKCADLARLVREAYSGKAYTRFGFTSWAEYCKAKFNDAQIYKTRGERDLMVKALKREAISNRVIAHLLGINEITVRRSAQQFIKDGNCDINVAVATLPRVLSADGKTRSTNRAACEIAKSFIEYSQYVNKGKNSSDISHLTGIPRKTISYALDIRNVSILEVSKLFLLARLKQLDGYSNASIQQYLQLSSSALEWLFGNGYKTFCAYYIGKNGVTRSIINETSVVEWTKSNHESSLTLINGDTVNQAKLATILQCTQPLVSIHLADWVEELEVEVPSRQKTAITTDTSVSVNNDCLQDNRKRETIADYFMNCFETWDTGKYSISPAKEEFDDACRTASYFYDSTEGLVEKTAKQFSDLLTHVDSKFTTLDNLVAYSNNITSLLDENARQELIQSYKERLTTISRALKKLER